MLNLIMKQIIIKMTLQIPKHIVWVFFAVESPISLPFLVYI